MSKEIEKVAVTGATSKMGQAILHEGRKASGVEFIALGRDSARLDKLRNEGFEARSYDLDYPAQTIAETIADIDAVIHLAGSSTEADNFALHEQYIHQATKRAAEASAHVGAAFLPVGSVSQHTGSLEELIDDKTARRSKGGYGGAKIRAFESAKEFETEEARARGYKVIQLSPGIVLGPDEKWTDELIATAKSGDVKRELFFRSILNSEIPWTDSEDLARLFVQIATNPYVTLQDRYLVVNGMGNTNDIIHTMYDIAQKPRLKPLPKKVTEVTIRTALWFERTMQRKINEISPESVSFAIYGRRRHFQSSGLKTEFGWRPKTLEQTLSEIKSGYKQRK